MYIVKMHRIWYIGGQQMDREKFLQLTLEAESTLFHISFSILHDEQDCADAVQEGILKAYMQ